MDTPTHTSGTSYGQAQGTGASGSGTQAPGTHAPGARTSRSGIPVTGAPAPHRRFPGWRSVLREPFRSATWRRVAHLLLALPLALLCLPVAFLGGPVGRMQFWLVRRVLRADPGTEIRERAGPLGVVHALAVAPLALVSVVVVGYGWSLVALNLGYPLRVDNDFARSWGGPTLAGAWAVHAAGGVVFLLLMPWVVKGLSALHVRLATGLLGRERAGLGRSVALALGVAALCGLLSVPVIHQL
ncbi:sensor domain-containing protein [Streptomyces sp. NPDC058657]|uniref:sensor domain-containing protein n=1 Tax=unclassified Streptomyces TaxID=2593676 RepID=UPI0036581E8E